MYVTIQGDTWDKIALNVYGSIAGLNNLMNANRAHIDTIVFNSGVSITVPDAVVEKSSKLPPWKR